MKYFSTSMMCVNMFDLGVKFPIIDKYSDFYHIDIMDGHFVPNIALSFDFVKHLRERTSKPIDVHLMVTDPSIYLDLLIGIGVDLIIIHPAPILEKVQGIIEKVKRSNIKIGFALSPNDKLEIIKPFHGQFEKLVIMTVNPGFAGQQVIESTICKIKESSAYRKENKLDYLIEVDGSNNFSTFERYYRNGADSFILGSILFKDEMIEEMYQRIQNYIRNLS